jgi:hypothetical protein
MRVREVIPIALIVGYGANVDANAHTSVRPIARDGSEPISASAPDDRGRAHLASTTSDLCVRVYDNTGTPGDLFYGGQAGAEAIDDVHGEESGHLAAITFEYYQPDTGAAPFDAVVRVYDNPGGKDVGIVPLYGPLEVQGLMPGRHTIRVDVPHGPELGPDAWIGVRFTNLRAGLVIQEEPIVGESHDFYVENGSFFYFAGEPVANFGISMDVRQPPPPVSLIALHDMSGSVDELLRATDVAQGQFERVGPLGRTFIETEALAVLPPGPTCEAAELLIDRIVVVDSDRLIELDPQSGEGDLIGMVGVPSIRGIAFNLVARELYGVTSPANQIVAIDLETGLGSPVSQVGLARESLNDLAFHPDGRAFITTDGAPVVQQIDVETGIAARKWRLSGATAMRALTWSQDGTTLYALASREGFHELAVVELDSKEDVGTLQFLSPGWIPFHAIEDIAWLETQMAQALLTQNTGTGPLPQATFRLFPNRPNPFNPATRIDFEVAMPQSVEVAIHDVTGRLVYRLLEEHVDAGLHHVIWDGRTRKGGRAPSGVYYCTLQGQEQRASRAIVLIR